MLIDLQKAFDSVDRELLFNLLEDTGIDPTISDILKSAYAHERSALLLNNANQVSFSVQKGVRQGACSSPILFNLIPNELAKSMRDIDVGVPLEDDTKVN